MRTILSEHEKLRNQNINTIKRSIRGLEFMGYKISIDKDVETMFGGLVDNIYVRDYMNGKIILQKHLFSIDQK